MQHGIDFRLVQPGQPPFAGQMVSLQIVQHLRQICCRLVVSIRADEEDRIVLEASGPRQPWLKLWNCRADPAPPPRCSD